MILIISKSDDPHARVVSLGLRELNKSVQVWNTVASTLEQATTLKVDKHVSLHFENDALRWSGNQVKVVWYRREGSVLPPSQLHPSCHEIYKQELLQATRSAFTTLESLGAIWVNSWINARKANDKLLQLVFAKECGFNIPQTIISNSPDQIRTFFDECKGRVVQKLFYAASFETDKVACTTSVSSYALTLTDSLAICPTIYQQRIDKAYDVRVLIMGSTAISVKLNGIDGELDIRTNKTLVGTRIDLPFEVEEACIRLVKSLGLLTGSIDLAYTNDGRWVFFEVNESGQFLWLETLVPDLPILDAFCRFLCEPNEGYMYKPGARRLSAVELLHTEFASGSQIPSNSSTTH